ncbi:MAG: KH domain-containing protein [Armatimonadetes bacterium]|nr:KH domain-containing protein [Armatimonadota bacterium]
MNEVITLLVRALVDHPDQVEVKQVETDRRDLIRLEVRVAASDTGKVIGKHGRIAAALRAVGRAAAARQGKRGFVDIVS